MVAGNTKSRWLLTYRSIRSIRRSGWQFMRADAGLRVLLTTRTLARASGLEENDEELRLVYVEEAEQAGSSENPRDRHQRRTVGLS